MIRARPRITVLIPAHDEEESLPAVLTALKALDPPVEILVVDNGSSDQTAMVAARAGLTVVYEPELGYGAACLAGIEVLAQRADPPDVLVISDADGADDPADLERLVAPIRGGEADLVIGSRTLGRPDEGALTPQARVGNAIATSLMALVHDHRFSDLGPFRAIRFSSLMALGMEDRTWGWNVEMQLKALKGGLKIQEIPVGYRRRLAGQSKISGSLPGAIRAGARMLWAVYRYR